MDSLDWRGHLVQKESLAPQGHQYRAQDLVELPNPILCRRKGTPDPE